MPRILYFGTKLSRSSAAQAAFRITGEGVSPVALCPVGLWEAGQSLELVWNFSCTKGNRSTEGLWTSTTF